MSVAQHVKQIVEAFKKEPRNKVFVEFAALLDSAAEETGEKITKDKLKKTIERYMSGEMKSTDETIYDGAVAIVGAVARGCFGKNLDDDVDYSVSWLEQEDGSFTAEVRPC